MEWSRRSPIRVFKSRRRHEANPVRVPEVEACRCPLTLNFMHQQYMKKDQKDKSTVV
jgi:Rps23 Pro-64 3,4-dihydroxylase Tpa1-like proline 4-hydroxylase